MSIADRSILSCWGVNGGRAGRPFQVTVDPGGPREREVDALADAEPVRAGEGIRIRTTGGGGGGGPLGRTAACAPPPPRTPPPCRTTRSPPRGGGRVARGRPRRSSPAAPAPPAS